MTSVVISSKGDNYPWMRKKYNNKWETLYTNHGSNESSQLSLYQLRTKGENSSDIQRFEISQLNNNIIEQNRIQIWIWSPTLNTESHVSYVGFWNAQISLILKLRKDRRTKFLLKLGIKVCRIITERYRHLILYKRR
jgi:hypothetical protein